MKKIRVLIVDDSSVMRKIVERSLRQAGIEVSDVIEANNGIEGLSQVEQNSVDLILTDINMPLMDGLEFVRQLQATEKAKGIPIVMISTEGSESHVVQALSSDARGDAILGEQGPIRVEGGPVSISADGTVSVRGAIVGRVRVVEFAPGAALRLEGNTYFSAPADAGRPATASRIRQGALEASNLSPVAGAVSLIALQRHAEMLERTLSIFHTEFNRMAAEDLPRV